MVAALNESSVFDIPQEAEAEDGRYLGPACVKQVAGRQVLIALPNKNVWASLALAYPYNPVTDDIVLAISQGAMCYVIGVLEGHGKTSFVAPGDMEFLAPRGSIDFLASKGCRLQSPEVTIQARKLDIAADKVFETFTTATRWVKDAFHIRAERIRTRVSSSYDVKADRIIQIADSVVKIDAKKIHLG